MKIISTKFFLSVTKRVLSGNLGVLKFPFKFLEIVVHSVLY